MSASIQFFVRFSADSEIRNSLIVRILHHRDTEGTERTHQKPGAAATLSIRRVFPIQTAPAMRTSAAISSTG